MDKMCGEAFKEKQKHGGKVKIIHREFLKNAPSPDVVICISC